MLGVNGKTLKMSKLQDLASERAVLAGLCQYGLDYYLDIDFITSEDFTDDMNKVLFDCIYRIISENSKIELSSILSAANTLGVNQIINSKDEISFIRSLFNFPIDRSNCEIYAAKISKLKLARELKSTLNKCEKELSSITGEEDVMEMI